MGSTSDLPIMEKACKLLDEMQVPFEVNALSAHRTPDAVEEFARTAKDRGIKVIIAGAGSIIQMPPGIPVATVGVNGAQNAAILACEMMALADQDLAQRLAVYKGNLRIKIEKANEELATVKYQFKTN